MTPGQWVLIIVCAVFGFGIVSNMLGGPKKPDPPEDESQGGGTG